MPNAIKVTVVVLILGSIVFACAKRVMLRFSSEEDFDRRRNVWLLLSATGLLSSSFWIFAAVAVPVLYWAARKDKNPVAFYLLMLHVVPAVPVDIPPILVNDLFKLDIYRLLALCVLLPMMRLVRRDGLLVRRFDALDWLVIAFGIMQTAVFVRPDIPNSHLLHDSITSMFRRGFLYYIDVYLVYYVISRYCTDRARMTESMATFCLACMLMALIGSFENIKHWWLYSEIVANWGTDPAGGAYLLRGNTLRAQASAGHPLALGYLLAIALGLWLYLRPQIRSRWLGIGGIILLCLGLLSAYSRGPWIGALVIYFALALFGPKSLSRSLKALVGAAVILTGLLLSPLGDQLIKVIPFLGGSVDAGSVTYRQMLLDRSLQLIAQHPLLGDPEALTKMGDLRQGQGIIDLVNTYASVTLFYGLLGLALFLGVSLLASVRLYNLARHAKQSDPDSTALAAVLLACIVGTLVMISTCSFILAYQKLYYILAALGTAYYYSAAKSGVAALNSPAAAHRQPAAT